jgi:hypothetical protein
MFNFLRPKTEQKTPAVMRIPRKEFDAIVGGAMAAMRELPDIAMHAKSRLYERDRPIVQADLEELLRMLAEAKQRIDAEMQSDIAKSANTDDTEWDKAGYNVLVAPTIQMSSRGGAKKSITSLSSRNHASCSAPPGMTTTSPGPQTRCSLPRRNSNLPLSIHTICSFA